jgi:hypothetical protein
MRNIIIAGVVAALVSATAATATTKLVITSAQIKNGTIKMVDMSAGAKRGLKGTRGRQGPPGPAGLQGPQGLQGLQGPPGLSNVQHVSSISTADPDGIHTADCPAGKYVTGGGGIEGGAGYLWSSRPLDGDSWIVAGDPGSTMHVYAICASLAQPPLGPAFLGQAVEHAAR